MGKMKRIPPEMQARFARNVRLLEERIAYHEKKRAEEKELRGGQSQA
jgi:hypothetical protein